ncbi:MAG: hypothetical protein WCA07_05360 [Gloeobacterales cyanobacterium]
MPTARQAERPIQRPQPICRIFHDLLPIVPPHPSNQRCINQLSTGDIRLAHRMLVLLSHDHLIQRLW